MFSMALRPLPNAHRDNFCKAGKFLEAEIGKFEPAFRTNRIHRSRDHGQADGIQPDEERLQVDRVQ